MKKHFVKPLCAAFLLFSCSASAVNIADALKKKLVKAEIKWKSKFKEESTSQRHGKNIFIKLFNLSNQNINVDVPSGFVFTAEISELQNMLITENMKFVLVPKGNETKYTYGYCCEAKDRAPSENAAYKVKTLTTENLTKLAQFINDNKLNGYAVQRAVWCVSNKYDLDDINDENTETTDKLIRFTGNLLGYSDELIHKALVKSVQGGKEFEKMIAIDIPVLQNTYAWIVIQDVNNNTVQTIMTKQLIEKGQLQKQIGVSSIDLGKGDFTVRVYSTGFNVVEKKFHLDA